MDAARAHGQSLPHPTSSSRSLLSSSRSCPDKPQLSAWKGISRAGPAEDTGRRPALRWSCPAAGAFSTGDGGQHPGGARKAAGSRGHRQRRGSCWRGARGQTGGWTRERSAGTEVRTGRSRAARSGRPAEGSRGSARPTPRARSPGPAARLRAQQQERGQQPAQHVHGLAGAARDGADRPRGSKVASPAAARQHRRAGARRARRGRVGRMERGTLPAPPRAPRPPALAAPRAPPHRALATHLPRHVPHSPVPPPRPAGAPPSFATAATVSGPRRPRTPLGTVPSTLRPLRSCP